MDHTIENIETVADSISKSMNEDQLRQYVFDDLYAIMLASKVDFDLNVKIIQETGRCQLRLF